MLRRSFSILLFCGVSLLPAADATRVKLESPLKALYDAWKSKGNAGLQAEAQARGMSLLDGNRLSVRIAASSEKRVPQVRKAVVKYGGRIITTDEATLYADVPVSGLSKLASRSQVRGIYLDRADQHPLNRALNPGGPQGPSSGAIAK